MEMTWEDKKWVYNVPFALVPPMLIEQLRGKQFTLAEYEQWCEFMDDVPNIWNHALCDKDNNILYFVYGSINYLEKEIEVKRISMVPFYFPLKWEFIKRGLTSLEEYARKFDIKTIYSITDRWEGYMKNLPEGKAKVLDMRIVEVVW